MAGNLVAIYRDPSAADAAVRELLDLGIPRDRIHLSHRPDPSQPDLTVADGSASPASFEDARSRENRLSTTGAVVGSIAGAVLFGFLTVILGFLPGMEWILWEGEWTTIIGGAAVGALLGLVAGGLGLPIRRPGGSTNVDAREPRHRDANVTTRNEQTVLEVDADHDVSRLRAVLSRHGPIELHRLGPRPVEPTDTPAPSRRGLLSDVEIRDRQTRDRDGEPTV